MNAKEIIESLQLLPPDAPVYIATDSQGLLMVKQVVGYSITAQKFLAEVDLVMEPSDKDYAALISPFDP